MAPPSANGSDLGLGCVTFGREIDRAAAFAMMDRALEHGISLFDTAAVYGGGASETVLGEWLASRGTREQVKLATKILPPYEPGAIEGAVNLSLQRLGVATVDLLFLHRWDESVTDAAAQRAFDGLVGSGRVRALGASNFSSEQLERALTRQADLGVTRFQALQNIHNLAVRGIDAPMSELCARSGIAMIAYSPLGAGFLTGKHDQGVQPGSRFDIIPGHQNVYFNELARRRLDRLKLVAMRAGVPMAELALAWALRQPRISTVLVGGRTPAHLDQAMRAKAFDAPELLAALDAEAHLSPGRS